jgi:integrase
MTHQDMPRNAGSHSTARSGSQPERGEFIAPDVPTLAEVMAQIRADDGLKAHRRADLLSSLKRFAELMRQRPENMPAHAGTYRRRLADLHVFNLVEDERISPKRLRNICSDVLFAIRMYGPPRGRDSAQPDMTDEWWQLYQAVPGHDHARFSRFFRWCSRHHIAPASVDDAVVERYSTALKNDNFYADPETKIQRLTQKWNAMASLVEQWPSTQLAVPSRSRTYALTWSAFPSSLAVDTEVWLDRLARRDPLASDGPRVAVSESTIKRRRHQIRQLASALVLAGVAKPNDLGGLADLFAEGRCKAAMLFYYERAGRKITSQMTDYAYVLLQIARHHVKLVGDALDGVVNLTRACKLPPRGMTPKNAERLRQLDDPEKCERLLLFPERAFAKHAGAERRAGRPPTSKAVLEVQTALAIELLTRTLIRLGNLASIRIDQHIVRVGRGATQRSYLRIPSDEIKNGVAFEAELRPDVIAKIDLYVRHFRPHLAGADGPYLFPSKKGGHKRTENLGRQISKSLWREIGLRWNAHAFRHWAGTRFLDENPGAHETVRRMLGHRSIETTLRFYAASDNKAAARRYDEHVLRARANRGKLGGSHAKED